MYGNNHGLWKKRVRTVSRMPGWMLTAKGYVDSKFGDKVCIAYLEMLNKRALGNGMKEARISESYAKRFRVEARELLHEVQESKKAITMILTNEGDSVEILRRKIQMKDRIEKNLKRLTVILEELLEIESCLDMYIQSLNLDYGVKAAAYVKGVRAGKCPGFEIPDLNCNIPTSLGYDAYIALQEKIQEMLASKEGDFDV